MKQNNTYVVGSIIGPTGEGKSTLLGNLFFSDLKLDKKIYHEVSTIDQDEFLKFNEMFQDYTGEFKEILKKEALEDYNQWMTVKKSGNVRKEKDEICEYQNRLKDGNLLLETCDLLTININDLRNLKELDKNKLKKLCHITSKNPEEINNIMNDFKNTKHFNEFLVEYGNYNMDSCSTFVQNFLFKNT